MKAFPLIKGKNCIKWDPLSPIHMASGHWGQPRQLSLVLENVLFSAVKKTQILF